MSCSEVETTVMAVIGFLCRGEPSLAFPNISSIQKGLDNSQPPIPKDKDDEAYAPFDRYPDQIQKAENKEPKTAMLAPFVCQLDSVTPAFGASGVYTQFRSPLPNNSNSIILTV